MEPAKIDWKSIESVYVEDDVYENISAPKWVDFSAPENSIDDEAWFCRPDCRHPKTADDFFLRSPGSQGRLQRSGDDAAEKLPLGERYTRDPNLKRRGLIKPLIPPKSNVESENFTEDCENQNPNISTPLNHHYVPKFMKAAVKSSTEKKKLIPDASPINETPWLKRTLSAKNLFEGRNLLNQVTEFCQELKNLAMRAKERKKEEKRMSPVGGKKQLGKEATEREILVEVNGNEKEKNPLLEMSTPKSEPLKASCKLRRKKMGDETENIPPPSVDLKNIKRREESVLQIRTNPPSPQCFSANRGTSKVTPMKPSRCRPQERVIPQDSEQQQNKEVMRDQAEEAGNSGRRASVVVEREGRALDVFWLFKPCTLSS